MKIPFSRAYFVNIVQKTFFNHYIQLGKIQVQTLCNDRNITCLPGNFTSVSPLKQISFLLKNENKQTKIIR